MSFPDPFHWTIQSPGCSVNEKILKNFWPEIYHDQKKFVPRLPLRKIKSPEHSVNYKILKKILPQI